ncbi:MAG: glycosyltransferase, partial [Bacteroidetes bacterium]
MDLSIVIPAYNEEGKIVKDLAAASAFLSARSLNGEIIVVNDGSTDGSVAQARRFSPAEGVSLVVLDHRVH